MRKIPRTPEEQPTQFRFTPNGLAALVKLPPRRYTDLKCEGLSADVKANGKIHFLIRFRDRDGASVAMYLHQRFRVPIPPGSDDLKAARDKADDLLTDWRVHGIDPRDATQHKKGSEQKFSDDLETYIKIKSPNWKTPETADAMRKRFENYCQKLLRMRTQDITAADVAEVMTNVRSSPLRPGYDMLCTAEILLTEIGAVIRVAMKGRYKRRFPRTYENPIDGLEGFIDLPEHETVHHASMSVEPDNQQMGVADFYAEIFLLRTRTRDKNGKGYGMHRRQRMIADIATRFLLLSVTPRTKEIREATWEQMFLDGPYPEWIIPAKIMKVRKRSRRRRDQRNVPLSYLAVALLKSIRPPDWKPTDYVFSFDGKNMVSRSTLWMLLRRMKLNFATPHGFRTTMQDFTAMYYPQLTVAAQIALDHDAYKDINDTYLQTTLPKHRMVLAEVFGEFLESELPLDMRTPRAAFIGERRQSWLAPPPDWTQVPPRAQREAPAGAAGMLAAD